MFVAVRQVLKRFGPAVDRWTLIGLAVFVGLYLALDIGQSALTGQPPRALGLVEVAFISLGALAALCLGYASLLPEDDQNRRSFVAAGANFFQAVTYVTLAAAFEQLMRLYTQPPYSRWVVLYAVVLAMLIIGSTYLFARALIPAWKGVSTLLAVFERLEASSEVSHESLERK